MNRFKPLGWNHDRELAMWVSLSVYT